jgi:hypothetical protein
MTAVMVEITPKRTRAKDDDQGDDGIMLIDNVEEFTASAQPGCNDDNPYT